LSGLDRIREAAKKDKNLRFTSLMHHITIDLLREAYKALKRNAAPGIDDVTWQQYGEELEGNLTNLHQRVQSGRYRFTHICATTRKNNCFTVRRKTIAKRLKGKAKAVREEIMRRRHDPVSEQGKWLRSVVQGHLNYFAVPGNKPSIDAFRTEVIKGWLHALRRRSQKSRRLSWERVMRLVITWIPRARILHPYPSQRLRVINPR
jgi:hypothetical protein